MYGWQTRLRANLCVTCRTGVGKIRPAGRFRPVKQNHLAHSPFTKCSTCMVRLVVLCFINLPSLQLHVLQYLSRSTCKKPHCAIYVLFFWDFVMNCEKRELIWLKWHKFPTIFNIINSKMNGIVGGKLVWPSIPCRVSFWTATRERLPTPDVGDGSTKTAFQVKLEINLCARISSALHRCLRETRVEELVYFSFSEVCVKTIWSSRSESCVLTYRFAYTLATLGIMLNITEISHDLIFSRYQLSRFFLRFRVFLTILYGTKLYRLW